MIETVAVVVLTATVLVGVLAAVVWLLRGRLVRVVWEAVRAERERRATWTGKRPRELMEVMYSGSSGDDPALEEERRVRAEREQKAREFAGKLEAGRVVRQQRGLQ